MSQDDHEGGGEYDQKTARTVGQLVKYSREVNQSETVEEVGTYALEATFHVMDGHPSPTVIEARQGDLRVLESMSADIESGSGPPAVERHAYETGKTVVLSGGETAVNYSSEDVLVVSGADLGVEGDGVVIASPTVNETGMGDTGVVVSVRWPALDSVEEYHVKPLEYMADHVSTAIDNIRSREGLERARNDLATRKEMIEMYDRLLRHDLGNDLQVIAGFSDALVTSIGDSGQSSEYAEKIHRTARSAADLIDRVGDLVKTLEQEDEPESRELQPILAAVVEDVDAKFESLTVEFEPAEFDYRVFAGGLLDSVFTNVLSNAAVHNAGPVTVRLYADEPTPETVVVGMADDGSGIPEEIRDDIFEMGKKGPDSDGTGFGLGFVRALTESYGGGVEVYSSEDGGADFRITLDRA
jgi:signal transduction histidine kinase